ncbi:MAG: ABC transporter permease [Chloroflexi bacterium]|nr:ABC transporter permease [Chloroflexota bacterium]
MIPTMLAIFTITFFLMHATPGSPWDNSGRPLPQHVIENLDAKYGLDKPIIEQYFIFLWGILSRGDLGDSYTRAGQSVSGILIEHFPVSLQLGLLAMTFAVIVGLTLGLLGALRPNSPLDYLTTFLSVVGISTPSYVAATLMVILFSLWLGWLPTGGWDGIFSNRVIIPVIALGLGPMATMARYTRSAVLEVLSQDYVRTAHAKGVAVRNVHIRHVLPNALISVVTVAGISLVNVVAGSFFVESILNIPGIGRYFVTSVTGRDYPVIIGTTLLYAVLVMVMNFIIDIAYTLLDPRIKFGQ